MGLASFGRGYAVITAIIVSIFAIILACYGVYLLFHQNVVIKDKEGKKEDVKGLAIVCIAVAVIVFIMTWVFVWLTYKYKAVAEIEGVAGGINIAEQIIK